MTTQSNRHTRLATLAVVTGAALAACPGEHACASPVTIDFLFEHYMVGGLLQIAPETPQVYQEINSTTSLSGTLGGASFSASVGLGLVQNLTTESAHFIWSGTATAHAAVEEGWPEAVAHAAAGITRLEITFQVHEPVVYTGTTPLGGHVHGSILEPGYYDFTSATGIAWAVTAYLTAGQTQTVTDHAGFDFGFVVIPSPSPLWICAAGLLGCAARRRRD